MAAGRYTHCISVDIADLDIVNEPHLYNHEHMHFILKGILTPTYMIWNLSRYSLYSVSLFEHFVIRYINLFPT